MVWLVLLALVFGWGWVWRVGLLGVWSGFKAHCWGLRNQPARGFVDAAVVVSVGRGWLFWLVLHAGGCPGWGACWCGGVVVWVLNSGREHLCSLLFVECWFVCLVTSYEGHMVDALASRADEGRRSLR